MNKQNQILQILKLLECTVKNNDRPIDLSHYTDLIDKVYSADTNINNEYQMVYDFHKAFNHPTSETPTLMNMGRARKRAGWLKEEIDEFIEATLEGDIYEQADAMIDVIYFALGTLVELGIKPAEIFGIVQNANMSKLWEDGKPRFRENDGKVIKPPTWQDPNQLIRKAIDEMK